MFPTVSTIINYFFGTDFSWPIPTFGFFVALAFVFSYFTFANGFSWKEKLGVFAEIKLSKTSRRNTFQWEIILYALTGFIVGFKGIGALLASETFPNSPFSWLFSMQGNWITGIIFALLFICYYVYFYRKEPLVHERRGDQSISAKQLLPSFVLWAAISGFLGAKLLHVFEDYEQFKIYGIGNLLHSTGLTFWGGLIFGGASYFYLGIKRGLNWKHLADIGSLGMLVAYGVGRMGCHLSGDGDWGIVNTIEKPVEWWPDWAWSFRFPHNTLGLGNYIPGCDGPFCYVLPEGVFPTSLYESIGILAVFLILFSFRNKWNIPGLIFTIYLYVISLERFFIEFIRVNYKFKVLGFYLSEAQLISLFLFLIAIWMSVFIVTRRDKESNDSTCHTL